MNDSALAKSRLASATTVAAPLSRIAGQLRRMILAVLRMPQRSGAVVVSGFMAARMSISGS